MDEFTEVEVSSESYAGVNHKYRLVPQAMLLADFYSLWNRAVLLNDWDAYREMISERFPSEWTYPAPPDFAFKDESLIPAEFIMLPLGMDDEPEERHRLRAVLAPDDYSIAAWLAAEAEKA